MSLNKDAFKVLHEDLANVRSEFSNKDRILCPLCLREITKIEVLESGIEHIIPKNIIRVDCEDKKQLGTINQRCGITVLCRQKRECKSDLKVSKNGCNGLKGRLYDRLWQKHWQDDKINPNDFTHRHGVSILIMAYLGAFQVYGYEYILQPEFNEIRKQFDYPDSRITEWLDYAQVCLLSDSDNYIATSTGHPFITDGIVAEGYPLDVSFRCFRQDII